MIGQFTFGLELFPLSFLVVIGLLVMGVVAVATRSETDPTNRRPYGVYLFVATFVALFVTLGAVAAILQGLGRVAIGDDSRFSWVGVESVSGSGVGGGPGSHPPPSAPLEEEVVYADQFTSSGRREAARAVTEATVAAVVAFVLLAFHARRARDLADDPTYRDGAGRRTYQTYLYATLFVAAFGIAAAAVAAGRGLLGVIFGQTLAFGSRDVGFRDFVANALFAGALAFVFRYHWLRAEAVRLAPAAAEPTVEVPPVSRPARKRATKPAPKRTPKAGPR